MSLEQLSEVLAVCHREGLTLDDVRKAVDAAYGVRVVEGFEVCQGWELPAAPREGMFPCVEFHGGDGLSHFWWDKAWGQYPDGSKAWEKEQESGTDFPCIEGPFVNPDTGANYKGCEDAYAALGFYVC